jgi:acetyl-CoA acyltransferase 1
MSHLRQVVSTRCRPRLILFRTKSSLTEATSLQKNPDDVVITLALRTPLCKYNKGSLKDTPLDTLVFKTLEQVRQRSNLDPALVGDICLGNVREGKSGYYCRAASLAAGFPNTTCTSHASRFCSSGLTATQHIANEIITGTIDVGVYCQTFWPNSLCSCAYFAGIAVGAESLSQGNERLSRPFADELREASQEVKDAELPMGNTSENVARDFGVGRQMQVN